MPYIDANVIIYPVLYTEEQEPKVNPAKQILLNIAEGELQAYTSTLTWDEVVWIVRKTMGRDEAVSQGQKLLGFSNLNWIPVDDNILSRSQAVMSKYALGPRDSIHIASAVDRKIHLVISDDEDFDRVKEIRRQPLI